MEGEALFLPALKRFQTLYPGVYTQGTTGLPPLGPEGRELVLDLGAHTGAVGVGLFPGGGDPSPTRMP